MRLAIVDDEHDQIEIMYRYVRKYLENYQFDSLLIDTFQTAENFEEAFEAKKYDLVILDIYINDVLGVDVASRIRKIDPDFALVFYTTSNDFAPESYLVNAQYYLHKPLEYSNMEPMFKRLDLKEMRKKKLVTFPDEFQCCLYDIEYTDYYNHKITIHMVDGETHSLYMNQKELEALLLPYTLFCSIHKGTIVSLDMVERVEDRSVILKNNTYLPITKKRVKEVKENLMKYKMRNYSTQPA